EIKLDSSREVRLSLGEHPYLDCGYAVTSHSSQVATTDRVLINVNSEQAGEQRINSRLAYVTISPARRATQIYTNDAQNLGEDLSRVKCPTPRRSRIGNTTPANRTTPDQ